MASAADNETVYENKQWTDRWVDDRIGWHLEAYNPVLDVISENLKPAGFSGAIFVPLCGASMDLLWLAEQPSVTAVVGVELSSIAIERFFKSEQVAAAYSSEAKENLKIHTSGKITIIEGDLFKCEEILKSFEFSSVYDRASLVAINWEDRVKYVDLMMAILANKGAFYSLVGMNYEKGTWPGPPHRVDEEMVADLFTKKVKDIKHIEKKDLGVRFSNVQVYQDTWLMKL